MGYILRHASTLWVNNLFHFTKETLLTFRHSTLNCVSAGSKVLSFAWQIKDFLGIPLLKMFHNPSGRDPNIQIIIGILYLCSPPKKPLSTNHYTPENSRKFPPFFNRKYINPFMVGIFQRSSSWGLRWWGYCAPPQGHENQGHGFALQFL